jgi:cell division protein FtsZ
MQSRERGSSGSRETWRTDGDVVIEEGLSHLSQHAQSPPPAPERADATGMNADNFNPARPTEFRRGQRRMPAVEDFPPVAQREYRAKVGYPPQEPSYANPHAVEEPPRRGLLQRILGRSKRADDAQSVDLYEHRFEDSNHASGPPAQGHGSANSVADHDSISREAADEEQSFPEIFRRGRK